MKTPEELCSEFEALARPLIEWMCSNCHPHVTSILTPTGAELTEGMVSFQTDDYVKD